VLVGGLIATTGIAAVTSLLVGLAHRWLPSQETPSRGRDIAAGFGLGALLSGLGAAGAAVAPARLPTWPNLNGAADSFPALGAALGPLSSWITSTALILVAVALVQALTGGWQRRYAAGSAILIGLGMVVAGSDGVETIPLWLAAGILTGIVLLAAWVLVIRRHPALVPLVTAAGIVFGAIHDAVVDAYPGVAPGSLIGAVLVAAAAVWWHRRLAADHAAPENAEPLSASV